MYLYTGETPYHVIWMSDTAVRKDRRVLRKTPCTVESQDKIKSFYWYSKT